MRCPKCSFISFDMVETCVKCGKNISAATAELHGTVAAIAAPAFLRFEYQEPGPETAGEGATEGEVTFDLGGGEEEAIIDLGGEETPALDLGGAGEGQAEPAFDLGLAGGTAAEAPVFAEPEAEASQAAAFEISDLAPPQEEAAPVAEGATEELAVAAAEPSHSAQARGGLADLKVEGLDLEAGPAKGKVMPSIKTGTALDEFDIDLGDLIPKKK